MSTVPASSALSGRAAPCCPAAPPGPTAPSAPARAQRRLAVALSLLVLLTGSAATAPAQAAPAPAGGSVPSAPGPGAAATAAATAAVPVPRPAHTVVVVLENKNRSSVIGSPDAPYLNELAGRGANMSQSYGVTHPSQPNYVALFSGSQQGVTTNACRDIGRVANLASQLEAAGQSFVGYAESLPSPGYRGCVSGRYQRKHAPWVSFTNLRPALNQPFRAFPTDYNRLPTVSFVTPDMCSDMHDCPVATGDAWLRRHLDGYARWAMTHNSLLVVTFDENAGGSVNQIATLLLGQRVRPGLYGERMNHYTLLRTLEQAYGLPPLGHAADVAPLQTIWTTSTPPATGVANGTFEAKLSRWVASGSTTTSTLHRHGGARSARAGATTATRGDSVISQTVTVPKGSSRLSVWWQGRCSDRVSRAWATVVVRRNTAGSTATLLPRTCVRSGSWRKVSLAVTPGHSYTVRLVNHDDGVASTPNRTYFDDVVLS